MYYIQETDKPNYILKLFNIVKLKENKIILPIEAEEKMDLKKSKVLANKTKKILSKTNCNKVILSKEIKKQQDYKNYLYTYNHSNASHYILLARCYLVSYKRNIAHFLYKRIFGI